MSYGIDAPIDPVQTPQKHPTIDRRSTETELDELPARDHTVLSGRQPGKGALTRRELFPHTGDKSRRVDFLPLGGVLLEHGHELRHAQAVRLLAQ
jgi:hypothetical protein